MNYKLETKNLIIKTIKIPQDVEGFSDIMNRYSGMSKFMTWEPPVIKEVLIDKMKKSIEKGDLPFAIFFKKDGKEILAGEIVLRNLVWSQQQSAKNSAFLSFWISPDFGGKGLGAEMLEEICNFSFKTLGLRKLLAGCFTQNIGSQKLLEKMNFRKIGLSHNHYLKNHKWINSLRYELLSRKFLSEAEEQERKRVHKRPKTNKFISTEDLSYEEDGLKIRSLKSSDSKLVLDVLQKNPQISEFRNWNLPKTEEEVIKKIIKVKSEKDLNLGVFKDEQFIGRIYLGNFRFQQEAALKNSAFLYFWFISGINQDEEKDILKSFINYCFKILHLRKIFTPTFSRDKDSQELLKSLNFLLIGYWEDHYKKNGAYFDSMRYEILNPDLDKEVDSE